MRQFKFLSALFALLLCGVSATAATDSKWADKKVTAVAAAVQSVDDITTGFYLVRNDGHLTFLNEQNESSLMLTNIFSSAKTDPTAEELTNALAGTGKLNYVVYIEKNGTTCTIQMKSGKYVPVLKIGVGMNSETTAENYTINLIKAGYFYFTGTTTPTEKANWAPAINSSSTYHIDGNGDSRDGQEGSLTGWEGAISQSASNGAYQLYKVTLEDCPSVEVTCKVTKADTGVEIASVTGMMEEGKAISAYPFFANHYYTLTCTNSDKVVSQANNVFNFTATEAEKPFVYSYDNTKKWYAVKLRNNTNSGANNCLVRANDGAQGIMSGSSTFIASNITTKAGFDNGLWAFVKDGLGVKLLNKASGKYVTVPANATYSGNKIEMTLTESGTTFYTATGSSSADFCLTYNGTGSLGDHKSNRLCVWNGDNNFSNSKSDDGSGFKVQSADEDAILSIGKAAVTAELTDKGAAFDTTEKDPDATDAYLCRAIPTEGKSAIEAAKTEAQAATTTDQLDAAAQKGAAVQADLTVTPDPAAYYLIRSVNYKDDELAYLTTDAVKTGTDGNLNTTYDSDNNRQVKRAAKTTHQLVPMLWQFAKSGDGWKITNANVERSLRDYADQSTSAVDLPIATAGGGAYTLRTAPKATFTSTTSGKTNDGQTMVQLIANDRAICTNSDGTTTATTSLDASDAAGNYWQVIKVTEVPVTISAEAGWASVCFPFAVQVPSESGVKAYRATKAQGDVLTLAEIEGGLIPAKTGVLLAKDGGTTVSLTITTGGAVESNALQGVTAKRDGFTKGNTYFLALNSESKAAFLQGDITTVPCNKAYLPASAITSSDPAQPAATLNFAFAGDPTTGIDSAAQSGNGRAVKYYDLSGRRALFPANGVFVTDKGEKVFIK